MKQIEFAGKAIDQPYKCAPTNPSMKCHTIFEIPEENQSYVTGAKSFIESDCKCALTDQLSGFCSNILGTDYYKEYT